jgi:Flp pilus assembly protein TadD
MPHTVNGIGTRYVGKSNHEVMLGTCAACGFHGQVSAYNTRLCFVIFFIPVIPLGRKRIFNDCPRCRRHYAAPLAQWEAQKQLGVSGAAEEFRASPTAEKGLALHAQLIGFQQMQQAKELRSLLMEKFPSDAKLHETLGCALSQLGFDGDAEKFFQRAHELRPDLPHARAGMALKAVREQRLEDARALLDYMEKPGAGQLYILGPLETLADSYRSAGCAAEALDIYKVLLRELPQLAQNRVFRPKVEAAESSLRKKTGEKNASVLPRKKFSWGAFFGRRPSLNEPVSWKRALVIIATVILLIAGATMGFNEWTRWHRSVFVVNGLAAPVTVELAGAGAVTVRPGGHGLLTVKEGDYRAHITGAVKEEMDVSIRAADYGSRWGVKAVWIINPAGAAILERTNAIYSASHTPSTVDYMTGDTVMRVEGVHHPFEPLPRSLEMKSHERSRTLVGIEVWQGAASDFFQHARATKGEAEAARFAEQHLRTRPDDTALLDAYLSSLTTPAASDAAEKLLASQLGRRPVVMHWHRAYQSFIANPQREQRLIGEYDKMLQAEPDNSALVYLRGRISTEHAEGLRHFEKARTLDPKNPFPLYALGYDAFCAGDFESARPLLEQAAKLDPKDAGFAVILRALRSAMGENDAVEKELRVQFSRQPSSGGLLLQLVLHLAGNGRAAEAEKEIAALERSKANPDPGFRSSMKLFRAMALYAADDMPAIEKLLAGEKNPAAAKLRWHALIEEGKIAEAARVAEEVAGGDGMDHLALSVAASLGGDTAAANAARLRAIAALEGKGADNRRAAAMLGAAEPPTREQLDAVVVLPSEKALLCAALAQRFPARRAELGALAKKLNVERTFPFHLIRRAAEAK